MTIINKWRGVKKLKDDHIGEYHDFQTTQMGLYSLRNLSYRLISATLES